MRLVDRLHIGATLPLAAVSFSLTNGGQRMSAPRALGVVALFFAIVLAVQAANQTQRFEFNGSDRHLSLPQGAVLRVSDPRGGDETSVSYEDWAEHSTYWWRPSYLIPLPRAGRAIMRVYPPGDSWGVRVLVDVLPTSSLNSLRWQTLSARAALDLTGTEAIGRYLSLVNDYLSHPGVFTVRTEELGPGLQIEPQRDDLGANYRVVRLDSPQGQTLGYWAQWLDGNGPHTQLVYGRILSDERNHIIVQGQDHMAFLFEGTWPTEERTRVYDWEPGPAAAIYIMEWNDGVWEVGSRYGVPAEIGVFKTMIVNHVHLFQDAAWRYDPASGTVRLCQVTSPGACLRLQDWAGKPTFVHDVSGEVVW